MNKTSAKVTTPAKKTTVTKTATPVPKKPKRYGAINEHDQLDEEVLAAMRDIGKEHAAVSEMVRKYTMDLFVYAPTHADEWDEKRRRRCALHLNEVNGLLDRISKYDWSGKKYPTLTKEDARWVYNTFIEYLKHRPEYEHEFISTIEMAAEITGVHSPKTENGYIHIDNVVASFKVRELISDFFAEIRYVESEGMATERKCRTDAKMNGTYMESRGILGGIADGAPLKLKYFEQYSDREVPLKSGELVAVETHDKEYTHKMYFSVGRVISYDRTGGITIQQASATLMLEGERIEAIWRVTVDA